MDLIRNGELSMSILENFIVNYGYIAIFLVLVLGIIGMTIPIPDECMMLLIGYFTKVGTLDFKMSLAICLIGSIIGMLVSYFIGKMAGRPLVERFGKWIGFTEKRILKTAKWMNKYGPYSIIISYFIPGVRHITFYFCGVSQMRLQTFMVYSCFGAISWCLIYISFGRIF